MKINIFKIYPADLESLLHKIESVEMVEKYKNSSDGWTCTFYLSNKPEVDSIPWVDDYKSVISDLVGLKNKIYFALYICVKGDYCFVLTYGKSHFYVRNFCDLEFGLEMAKRIANEKDVKQKASKRFSGREKKGIKNFVKNTKLDSESGESIDYISASVLPDFQKIFGERSKFGSSMVVTREDLEILGIPSILDKAIDVLNEPPKFDLPKTSIITDDVKIAEYKKGLLDKIKKDISAIETNDSSYDLIGTDFIFSTNDNFTFRHGRNVSNEFLELKHEELKKFIVQYSIPDSEVFMIKVEIKNGNGKTYSKPLYEMIEYMVPGQNIILENGKWKEFNEEYLQQLNTSVDSIDVENTENQFEEISSTEPDFNNSAAILAAGYAKDDKDFSKISVSPGYKVEAWDLRKGNTVYAVKFGPAQKLSYVCSQAVATLEIIRNNANRKKFSSPPQEYCLWLGFERANVPSKISSVNSIILKQHIDMFARKCGDVGMKPVLKFSKKVSSHRV